MSSDAHGPQPTAHDTDVWERLLENDATRRGVLRGLGAAGTLTVAGTASSGTAAADSDLVDGIKDVITGAAIGVGAMAAAPVIAPATVAYVGGWAVGEVYGAITTDPAVNRLTIHEGVYSEVSTMDSHFTTFGNRMKDSRSIASLEARHGIANSWEDGGGAPESTDRAHERIRQYYALPEFNHLHAGTKTLLQLSYYAGAGYDTEPEYDFTEIATDADGNPLQVRLTDEREIVDTIELHDGTVVDETALEDVEHINPDESITVGAESDGADGEDIPAGMLYVPKVDLIDTSTDEVVDTQPIISNDVIESWDEEDETVAYTVDGTEYRTSLLLQTQNVGDAEETEAAGSIRAFDGREFFRLLHELRSHSDQVVDRYDNAFVEDIHAELIAENITPEQVRSAEGMARFLSGTDDPTDSRFRISWMQQFGFERADMTKVRGMDITWSGATDTFVDPDPSVDERRTFPTDRVFGDEYTGVLFSSDMPDTSPTPGHRYAVGLPVYSITYETLRALDPITLDEMWSTGVPQSGGPDSSFITDDGRRLYYGHNQEVHAVDLEEGSTLWRDDTEIGGHTPQGLGVTSDGERLYATTSSSGFSGYYIEDDGLNHQFSVDTGDNWPESLLLSDDEETLYVGFRSSTLIAYDLDGSMGEPTQKYEASLTGTDDLSSITEGPDGETLYATHGSVTALDPSDGSEKWSVSYTNDARDVSLPNNESVLVCAAYDDGVFGIDPDNGDELWHYDMEETAYTCHALPGGDRAVVGYQDGTATIDATDGTEINRKDHPENPGQVIARQPDGEFDGYAARSIMFDEGTEDREAEGEIDLWDGVLEVDDVWDADGATITHVSDETIDDLESLEGTPDSIDTIVDEMDEFDSVDDIRFKRHVEQILEHYDVDPDEVSVALEDTDYSSPDYDSFDSSEYAAQMEELEEMIDQLESEEDDDGISIPGLPGAGDLVDDYGAAAAGLVIIMGVVTVVAGVVTDFLPFLGE